MKSFQSDGARTWSTIVSSLMIRKAVVTGGAESACICALGLPVQSTIVEGVAAQVQVLQMTEKQNVVNGVRSEGFELTYKGT